MPWRVATCGLDFDRLPQGLKPPQALALLGQRKLTLAGVQQLVQQVELCEAAPLLRSWLPQARETLPRLQLLRALAIAEGTLSPQTRQTLQSQLGHLAEPHEWEALFQILSHVVEPELEIAARGALEARIQEHGTNNTTGRALTDLLENDAHRLVEATRIKQDVLARPRALRLEQEARIFAGLGPGYDEYLENWARSRLVRESWEPELADQTRRADRSELRAEVIAQLRQCLLESGTPEDKEAVRYKVLQGVQFLGGKLTRQESAFLKG